MRLSVELFEYTTSVALVPAFTMGLCGVNRPVIFVIGSILAVVNCQLKVKVIQPESIVPQTKFNWSELAGSGSFSSETSRYFNGLPSVSFIKQNQPLSKQSTYCDARCGLPYERGAPRVFGGETTTPNKFPWMVQVVIEAADFFKQKTMVCAATLIKQQYLLTAAHCVYHVKVISVTALIGFHYLDVKRFEKTGYEQVIPVAKAFIHEEFDPLFMKHDIAILELVSPVQFTDQVHTICLPQKIATTTESKGVIAGWGVTQVFGTQFYPQMLLSADVPLINLQDCKRTFANLGPLINEHSICAGGSLKDACLGDSGGPLMVANNSGAVRYNQHGIVSWGMGCGNPGKPGIYVGIQHHVAWIQDVTRKDTCLPYSPN